MSIRRAINVISVSVILLSIINTANANNKEHISWLTMEEAEQLHAAAPKPIMIYFYTGWCRFCRDMENYTFINEQLADFINQNFYPVKINAEGFDTIMFQGNVYINQDTASRSTHDFTGKLLEDRIAYPTLFFFNNQYKFRFVIPGYIPIEKLEPVLVYVMENVFYTEIYEPFEEAFLQTYRPEGARRVSIAERNRTPVIEHGKKTIISIDAEWCNSCSVMNHITFLDSTIEKLTNKYYSVSSIDISYSDTIYWYGRVFAPNPDGGAHPFITHFAGGRVILPLMFIFDEEGEILTPLPRYQPPASLETVLRYFGEDHYYTTPWEEYREKNDR